MTTGIKRKRNELVVKRHRLRVNEERACCSSFGICSNSNLISPDSLQSSVFLLFRGSYDRALFNGFQDVAGSDLRQIIFNQQPGNHITLQNLSFFSFIYTKSRVTDDDISIGLQTLIFKRLINAQYIYQAQSDKKKDRSWFLVDMAYASNEMYNILYQYVPTVLASLIGDYVKPKLSEIARPWKNEYGTLTKRVFVDPEYVKQQELKYVQDFIVFEDMILHKRLIDEGYFLAMNVRLIYQFCQLYKKKGSQFGDVWSATFVEEFREAIKFIMLAMLKDKKSTWHGRGILHDVQGHFRYDWLPRYDYGN